MIRQYLNDLVNFIYPPDCHLCGNPIAPHEKFICTHCLSQLPRTGYHRQPKNPMVDRFAGQFPFQRAAGHFFYSRDSALAQLIQDMKYRHFPGIGKVLGHLVGMELYSTGFFDGIDVITPVPMHFLKKARRGYNQTDAIAQGISEATGIPVRNLLKMKRMRKTQTALSREQRLNNALNLFTTTTSESMSGKGILLIDDVCTTGATLTGAATSITNKWPDCNLSLLTVAVTF